VISPFKSTGAPQDAAECLSIFFREVKKELAYYGRDGLIDDCFSINLECTSFCYYCKQYNQPKVFPYHQIRLPILINTESSLQDMLDNYFKPEIMEDPENLYFCGNCQNGEISSFKTTAKNAPDYLILTLNRFANTCQKILTKTDKPNEVKISVYFDEMSSVTENYQLVSIIVHVGGLQSTPADHYYLLSKDDNGSWISISDADAFDFDIGLNAINHTPYIYFYKKVSSDINDEKEIKIHDKIERLIHDDNNYFTTRMANIIDYKITKAQLKESLRMNSDD
jgi:ubiquitin C-terminal hydrolase